ncbi:MAG TPA: DNA gyrase inhibitor YacG [Nitrospirae bacterium]|nr:DNA gyrase inhibitor YacG [Nitrospirota bacterium]
MKVKCPTCKQKIEWENNPFRPFCSERCKLIDLGAWAKGEYKIEGELDDEMASSN